MSFSVRPGFAMVKARDNDLNRKGGGLAAAACLDRGTAMENAQVSVAISVFCALPQTRPKSRRTPR